jgi:hypothetical protein
MMTSLISFYEKTAIVVLKISRTLSPLRLLYTEFSVSPQFPLEVGKGGASRLRLALGKGRG